ncbi:MAG: transketolase [bacterium]|nr:transketolase [bacterium]
MDDRTGLAKKIRREVLEMLYRTKSPHIGGCFSCVEILIALYFEIMKVSPETKKNPERDIFILSKGHAAPALYSVLAERGFIPEEKLNSFAVDGGELEYHPRKNADFGIELTTGSLGYGISVGLGIAKARKPDGLKSKVFVLSSDGDMQEGSVWPALMLASKHNLDNLIVLVDYNRIQAIERTENILDLENLAEKFRAFGWEAREVNGHNVEQIIGACKNISKPTAIICNTIKGKGVSFMENEVVWHSRVPNDEEYQKAIAELKSI